MTSAPAAAGSRGAAVSAPAVVGGFGGNVFPAESVGMMAGTPRCRRIEWSGVSSGVISGEASTSNCICQRRPRGLSSTSNAR